jgi:hypothetical protein
MALCPLVRAVPGGDGRALKIGQNGNFVGTYKKIF